MRIFPARYVEIAGLAGIQGALAMVIVKSAATTNDAIAGVTTLSLGLVLSLSLTVTTERRPIALGVLVLAGTALAVVGASMAIEAKPLLHSARIRPLLSTPIGIPLSANVLAYLTLPAPIAGAALAATSRSLRSRVVWCAIVVIGILVLVYAGSRASLLGLAGGFGALMIAYAINRHRGYLAAVLVAVLAVGLTTEIFLLETTDRTLWTRAAIWTDLLHRPDIFAVSGFGLFAHTQLEDPIITTRFETPLTVHNAYIQTWLDFGALGSAIIATVVTYSLARAIWLLAHTSDTETAMGAARFAGALVVLGAMSALLLTSLFESDMSSAWRLSNGEVLAVVSPVPLLVASASIGLLTRHPAVQ